MNVDEGKVRRIRAILLTRNRDAAREGTNASGASSGEVLHGNQLGISENSPLALSPLARGSFLRSSIGANIDESHCLAIPATIRSRAAHALRNRSRRKVIKYAMERGEGDRRDRERAGETPVISSDVIECRGIGRARLHASSALLKIS